MVPVTDFRPLAGQQMQVGTLEEGPGIDEEGLQNLEKLKLNEGKVGQRRLRESRRRATHGEGGYRRVEQGFDGKNEPNCCRNSS